MTIYKEIIFNVETGEETKIEFTKKELDEYNAKLAEAEAFAVQLEAEGEAKEAARLATIEKLAALGLTPEDLAAL